MKEAVSLALLGGSVIDWRQLHFTDLEGVKNFLKINEFYPDRPQDNDRLMGIHNEAVGYLQYQLNIQLSEELLRPDKIQDLFLIASDFSQPKSQKLACGLLKVMNIINHIDGRELLYNCAISLRDLYSAVSDKIERQLSLLSRKEIPNLQYSGSRKQKESLITKLVAKRETIAAQINDRVRYRIITPKKEEILPVISHLFETVLPFNYVIPNASSNQLIDLKNLLDWKKRCSLKGYQTVQGLSQWLSRVFPYPPPEKEYSGETYRVIKFVVDIPVRLDRFLETGYRHLNTQSLGFITYVLVEFQILDQETDQLNSSGENEHSRYKTRQKSGVAKRLFP